MIITFGQHIGKSYEQLLFEHPEYILWMLSVDKPAGLLIGAVNKAQQLIKKLDSLPLSVYCKDNGCLEKATRCCLAESTLEPVWFCDRCSPNKPEGSTASPTILRSYFDFVRHAKLHGQGNGDFDKHLLQHYAAAKGVFQSPSTYKPENQWPAHHAPSAGHNQINGWGSSQWQRRFAGSRWPGKEQPVETKTTPIVN